MAVTAHWYGAGITALANKQVDWLNDTIVARLHTSTYVPNQDTDTVATNELSTANGYTAGGITLTSKTAAYDPTNNRVVLDAADVTWTVSSGTLTGRIVTIWDSTASKLLGYVDNGADFSAGTSLTITWDATGVLNLVAA